MLPAIELNNEVDLVANEIDNLSRDGMLTPEAKVGQLAAAQQRPKFALGVGGVLSHSPRELIEPGTEIVTAEHGLGLPLHAKRRLPRRRTLTPTLSLSTWRGGKRGRRSACD
jgi:hypothetical protein